MSCRRPEPLVQQPTVAGGLLRKVDTQTFTQASEHPRETRISFALCKFHLRYFCRRLIPMKMGKRKRNNTGNSEKKINTNATGSVEKLLTADEKAVDPALASLFASSATNS